MRSILFVDDDLRVTSALENALWKRRGQWKMTFCNSGYKALEVIQGERVDLVVADMRMPGMDGPELLQKIQDGWPEIVRVVLSAHTEFEAALNAVPIAHQFVTKPAEASELIAVIQRGLCIRDLLAETKLEGLLSQVSSLPPLPSVYHRLQERLRDPSCGMDEVARVVESDAATVASVLRTVNSAAFGVRYPISNIQQAVVYLGANMLRNLVISTCPSVQSELSVEAQLHVLLTAYIAREILHEDRYASETAYLAGVLHDIGKRVLETASPSDHAAASSSMGLRSWEAEIAALGTSHAEVGAYLLGTWGLAYDVVEGVGLHHRPSEAIGKRLSIPLVVAAADALAHEAVGDCDAFDLISWDVLAPTISQTRWKELQAIASTLRDKVAEDCV